MTRRSDEASVRDMLDAIALINEFVAAMTFERFTEDGKTRSAVIREIEVLGEAAKSVMIVQDTIELNLPELQSQLRSILNEMASG